MISIFIPVKNEELALPGCLESVAWSDDVHVCDSGSTDGTAAIAAEAGAHFIVSPSRFHANFGNNEAEYKNWALENLPFKYPWVLFLDADERATPALVEAAKAAVQNPQGNVAYRIQRRDFFLNTWLKHVQMTAFYLRLFRHDSVHYERPIHSPCIPAGPVAELPGYIDHFPFSKGIGQWFARHNAYSTLEAKHIVASRASKVQFSLLKAFTVKDAIERRFHQKEIYYRLPGRPILRFLVLYLAKRGFLDGYAGFTYSVLQAVYEYMIVLKTQELMSPVNERPGLASHELLERIPK
jgi:glycosyltransferase involved in cell wall biosynthesis